MELHERVAVSCTGLDSEDLYFAQQEQARLKALRAKAEQESDAAYRGAHKNHCFRCGTPSLAEVEYNGVRIDVCVNENCGAVHLDPGEMDALLQGSPKAIKRIQLAVFNIFK